MNQQIKIIVGIAIISISLVLLPGPIWAAKYTMSVNAGTKLGAWDRFYERAVSMDHAYTMINSAYNRNAVNALRKAHAEAGFQSVRAHGILDSDVGVYSEDASGQAVYNWTRFDQIYDSIKAVGMIPFVEIGFMPPALATASTTISSVWYNGVSGNWNAPKDMAKWRALVKELIRHCKSRYGENEVRNWFFELWNEPNWMYGGGGGYNGWKTLYQNTAQAIKEEDPLIKLGGPAESKGSSISAVPDFMKWTKQNGIKADFCSFHVYGNDMGGHCDSKGIIDFYQNTIYAAKNSNGFTGLLLNTEYGPSYSSGNSYRMVHDGEAAASFIAKTIHLFNMNAATLPPPYTLSFWAVSDVYEEYDNRGGSPAFSGCFGLFTRGDPLIPQSCDVAKPAFNAYKLLHLMKNSVLSTSGGTTASPGVNLAATVSAGNDTICILVYDHVDNPNGNSATVDSVTLNISNIPFAKAKIEHWVVDRTHSNAYQTWVGMGSPEKPTASQWTSIATASELAYYDTPSTVNIVNGAFTKKFAQNLYSVGLIQLTNADGASISAPVKPIFDAAKIKTRLSVNKLVLDLPSEKYRINLFSSSGRLVKSTYVCGPAVKEIFLGDLSAGAYFVECSWKSQKYVKSFVIGAGN
jgi:xylan 1,4-beta-xylosidase